MVWKSREWPGEPGTSAGTLAKWLDIQVNGDVKGYPEGKSAGTLAKWLEIQVNGDVTGYPET